MRRILAASIIALSCCLLSASTLGQQDFSTVEIKTYRVAGNIYMLEGRGGNIGVSVGPDGILIIDDQFAPLADKIKSALKELRTDRPRFILNTHWHGDHTGGNAAFGRDGVIIAHENVRKRLARKETLLGQPVEPAPKEGLPVVTYTESVSIHFNDEEIRVLHFPSGHTDGDSVVFFTSSNVVHMGDHMFAGKFPFVDLEHGGDVQGMADNVARVLAMIPKDAKIIPGHGPISTPEDLRMFHRMLTESLDIVRSRVAEGKTLDQIKAAGLPDAWKSWGDGFIKTDRWLETVYMSVTRK